MSAKFRHDLRERRLPKPLGGDRRRINLDGLRGGTQFPRTNAAGDQPEEGVKVRAANVSKGESQCRAAAAELSLQVTPLEFALADGLGETPSGTRACELRAIEGVAATQRLGVNVKEVGVDERDGVRPVPEAVKLGMMAVAARPAEKDLTSEERFPPERRETSGIEIPRMEGPESHGVRL